MKKRFVLCNVDEVPLNGSKLVNAKGRDIAVFNIEGEFYGLFNRCPHEGGSLVHGPRIGLVQSNEPGQYDYCRKGEIVRCPWHNWEFDIKTGRSVCRPDRIAVRNFSLQVAQGDELQVGELQAEKVDIRIEDRYIVVDL